MFRSMMKVRQLKKGQLHVAMMLRNAGEHFQNRRANFMAKQSKNLAGLFDRKDEGTAILRKVGELFTHGTA